MLVLVKGLIKPKQKRIGVGKKMTFVCTSDSAVTWYFNNERIVGTQYDIEVKKSQYFLTLRSPQRIDSGEYTCVGTDKDKNLFRSNSILIVTPSEDLE